FFVAETAAAAALLGLMFVAISINLNQVIDAGGLADRAFGALAILLGILIAGLLLAMPDQPAWVMGIETAAIALIIGAVVASVGRRGFVSADEEYRANFARNVALSLVALAPIFIGGLLMMGGGEAGFYFVAVGMCLSIVK